jgi:hypothetical protein
MWFNGIACVAPHMVVGGMRVMCTEGQPLLASLLYTFVLFAVVDAHGLATVV